MISFIVIGRNEGWKLTKCFQSIYEASSYNELTDYEIIYIDSKSTDDSIQRAKSFNEVQIYQITGKCNAAIARNIGGKVSKGDYLFFIDGDMEISTEFIKHALNFFFDNDDYVLTGHIIDRIYDLKGNHLGDKNRTFNYEIPKTEKQLLTCGGIFIMSKKLWNIAGGMRSKYNRSQDNDLTLRLKEKGYYTIRLPFLITIHNTVDYRNNIRMWKLLYSGATLYPAVILRDHINNSSILYKTFREHYTSLGLLLLVVTLFTYKPLYVIFTAIYIIVVFIRGTINVNSTFKSNSISYINYLFQRFVYQVIRDMLFLLAIVFFYPKSHKVEYEKVNKWS